jgi:hypothetical protein
MKKNDFSIFLLNRGLFAGLTIASQDMKKIVTLGVILILLCGAASVLGAQKTLTQYVRDENIDAKTTEPLSPRPDANTQVLSASGSNIISLLNTSGMTNYVAGGTYWDSRCGWSPWSLIKNLPLVNDPENSNCQIRALIVPMKTSSTAPLRQSWQTYGAVSYDFQVKLSWFYDLEYALSGVNFRWRESATAGKYQGYGVSFLYFNTQTSCTTNVDYIPHALKPLTDNTLRRKLLMVLWRQKVTGGVERRNWLAYAIMDDAKIQGGQSTYESKSMTDNVTLLVRAEDVLSKSQRYTDIKVYYGDSSNLNTARGFDATATNVYRAFYPPKCDSSEFPKWPSNTLEAYSANDPTSHYWSYSRWYPSIAYISGNTVIPVNRLASDNLPHTYRCITGGTTATTEPRWPVTTGATIGDGTAVWRENGTSRPTHYDYFTLVSADPKGPYNSVKWVINPALVNDVTLNNNPGATLSLQADRATFRATEFSLADYPASSPELAIHGMGNLTGGVFWPIWPWTYYDRGVAFTDMAVQILGKRE